MSVVILDIPTRKQNIEDMTCNEAASTRKQDSRHLEDFLFRSMYNRTILSLCIYIGTDYKFLYTTGDIAIRQAS